MNPFIDYDLLVKAERIRFQSDFSSAHWLHQVLCQYELGISSQKRRETYETVLRVAINHGLKKAIDLANAYPKTAGFPQYLKLEEENWRETCSSILENFGTHEFNRFKYVREGD